MGKSGHIAGKLAATLASTGTPAFFLHPAEASHGDLGNIVKNDVVLAISNSGNTPEILAILPMIKSLQVPLISITANPNAVLSKIANVNLDASITEEACPLGLVPTASTTAALAMGDALAITLLAMRGFTEQDFARNHPGGVIGKKLCLLVDDIMRKGNDIPKVLATTSVLDALVEMTQKRMGMTIVTDNKNKIVGVYTDGDLRRTLDKKIGLPNMQIKDVMTTSVKTIAPGTLALEALQLMEEYQITTLIIADKGVPIGAIHIHDLLKEGMK
jgi:arabinose-5-phosphate isomerase